MRKTNRTRPFSNSRARPRGRSRPRRDTTIDLDRYRSIIPDWTAFKETIVRPEPTVFRARRGRIEPAVLVARLEEQGFRLKPVEGLDDFFQVVDEPHPISFTLEHWMGLLYVQQASTGVAAPALAPERGDRVLDLCAAPGGKTCHAAELMEGTGALIAVDRSEPRIRGLLGNLYRLGYTNVSVVSADGRDLPENALFDRVLVDAPCSGEGTLRRRGGTAPQQSQSFKAYVTEAQDGLLRKAIRVTRPGGTILYVTCTFAPEENEAVIDRVLRDEPVELEPLKLAVAHAPGVTEWEGQTFDPRVAGAARIYPHHFDSGGLFLARLRRLEGDATGTGAEAEVSDEAVASGALEGGTEAGAGNGAWRPVPPSFPGEDVSPEEALEMADRGIASLRDDFHVSPELLDGLSWTVRGGRVWVHTMAGWPQEGWPEGSWRPISVGFRAFEFDSGGGARPTNDVLQWLGADIGARRVDLDDVQLRTLLVDRQLPAIPDLRGLIAFSWRDAVLGRGLATAEAVRSEVPKVRAADLKRVVEREG